MDSGPSDESGWLAAGFAAIDILKTYDHCRPQMGPQISEAVLLDLGKSPSDDNFVK